MDDAVAFSTQALSCQGILQKSTQKILKELNYFKWQTSLFHDSRPQQKKFTHDHGIASRLQIS
jgi:hypothetical protein